MSFLYRLRHLFLSYSFRCICYSYLFISICCICYNILFRSYTLLRFYSSRLKRHRMHCKLGLQLFYCHILCLNLLVKEIHTNTYKDEQHKRSYGEPIH